jgi:uncharacterized protein (TIRG00374 family)
MIKTILKFVLAIGLIYWLYNSGKLDLSLVKKSISMGPQWIFAVLLITLQAFSGTLRYQILLETKSKSDFSFKKLLPLNYIGFFFSSVLPGAVTGDIIKVVYIKKHDPSLSKTSLVTLTLLDRLLGLTGLLVLAGFFSLINYKSLIILSDKIPHLIHLNLLLCLGSLIFFGILISGRRVQKFATDFLRKIPLIGHKVSSIVEQLLSLHENRFDLLKCLGFSILSQFFGILAFWVVSSPFYQVKIPLSYAFSFIPIGLIATAIPISPGGLGVGHVLFANLFMLVGIDNGASLFNLFYLAAFLHNFSGVIPYLLIGKPKEVIEAY